MTSNNNYVNPNAKEAMKQFKMETAREVGVDLKEGYNGDLTSLGQHKRKPVFPIVIRESRGNWRKTTWLLRHRNMRPLSAIASPGKSHVPS